MKIKFCVFLLFVVTVNGHYSRGRRSKAEKPEKPEFKYPCVNRWYKYFHDDEPSEYGVRAGNYKRENPTFVGRGFIDGVLSLGYIQIKRPRGFYAKMGGVTSYNYDPMQTFYLFLDPDNKYKWVNATVGQNVTNAVDVGTETIGGPSFVTRFTSTTGGDACNPLESGLFYSDDAGSVMQQGDLNFQVLTCISRKPPHPCRPKPEKPRFTHSRVVSSNAQPSVPKCVNKWLPYNNDTQPTEDGVQFGENAYVGKVKIGSVWRPGHLQTVDRRGIYVLVNGSLGASASDNFYLWYNPAYTYRWQDASSDKFFENAVITDDANGQFKFPIARTTIDGAVSIGNLGGVGGLVFFDRNGKPHVTKNYQVLVCDARPRFKCAQQWKDFTPGASLTTEGINFNADKCKAPFYVGRHHTPCTDEIGKIYTAPGTDISGIAFIDGQTNFASFDSNNAQYLVKNSSYVYEWQPSSNGESIEHGVQIDVQNYFARFTLDGVSYIGAAPINGEGVIFTDDQGNKHIVANYEVLTCYSPFEDYTEPEVACRYNPDGTLCANNQIPSCVPSRCMIFCSAPNEYPDNVECTCKTCPGGQLFSVAQNICACAMTPNVPPNKIWDDVECVVKCKDVCPLDNDQDTNTCACLPSS